MFPPTVAPDKEVFEVLAWHDVRSPRTLQLVVDAESGVRAYWLFSFVL